MNLQPALGIAAWGALLGFILGLAIDALLYAQDGWFSEAALLPVFAPALYYLLWLFLVGPLNGEFGIADHEQRA